MLCVAFTLLNDRVHDVSLDILDRAWSAVLQGIVYVVSDSLVLSSYVAVAKYVAGIGNSQMAITLLACQDDSLGNNASYVCHANAKFELSLQNAIWVMDHVKFMTPATHQQCKRAVTRYDERARGLRAIGQAAPSDATPYVAILAMSDTSDTSDTSDACDPSDPSVQPVQPVQTGPTNATGPTIQFGVQPTCQASHIH